MRKNKKAILSLALAASLFLSGAHHMPPLVQDKK